MSNIQENIRVAFSSLLSNKLRALLTALGIGIGIASVITLVSLGQAAQDYINRQFLSVGSDLIFIRPGAPNGQAGGGGGGNPFQAPRRLSTSSLTDKDVKDLEDAGNIPDVKAVVPTMSVGARTDYGTNEVRNAVTATTLAYFDIESRTPESGRLFTADDETSNARVAVIGQTTVTNLFGADVSPIGETITINGVPFKVIGVLAKAGGSSFGADQDAVIIIPLSAAHAHLATERTATGDYPVSEIYLQADNVNNIDLITATTTQFLHQSHRIKPRDDDDFQVSSQKDLVGSLTGVIGVLTIFLSIIGGISLLVGGIGVMNIMLVTVTERTREIGLRKAVGARGLDVLSQFLTEATVLCFVGATAGLLLALGLVVATGALVPDLRPSVSVASIALAVGVTSFIDIFFGMYPASRAAALSPIQALRSE